MEFTITTPAVLFPALSLILLAHTNRFLALAAVIRNLKREFDSGHDESKAKQILSLQKRVVWIQQMQVFGVASLLACVVSMFAMFFAKIIVAQWLFALSLVLMSVSLLLSLREVYASLEALQLELRELGESAA